MKKESLHIAILCSRLDLPGGIERAVVNTANLFIANNHQVSLVILDETSKSFYPLHAGIRITQQPLSFGITPDGNVITRKLKLLGDVLKLRRILKELRADMVIATEYPLAVAAIMAGGRKYSTVVSWEHHHFYELKRNAFWNRLYRLTYPRLDGIICLNDDEKRLFGTINKNPVVIPNFIQQGIYERAPAKLILTVARLTAVKGIEHLLAAAKEVLGKHPDWQWKLIGDGEMKDVVTAFIKKEKLESRLLLQLPVDHDIQGEYLQASLYVMTSENECFPMTLLEAQAAGLPSVAFDCESGPRHIISRENGILVEKGNVAALTEAISLLISDEQLREQLGRNARENSNRFSDGAVYELWKEKEFSLL